MKTDTNVPLSSLATFRVGGPARFVHTIETADDLTNLFSSADMHKSRWYVVGGGSNVLPTDEGFDGHVLLMRIQGQEIVREDSNEVFIRVGAGESWDGFVEAVVSRGLWGVENLSSIPGTVGGTPIQNVAAYGAEVGNVIEAVEVFDTITRTTRTMTNKECLFGYRDSIFKKEEGKHLIVTAVVFRLLKTGTPDIAYKDLTEYFSVNEKTLTPHEVRKGVSEIRSKKFPDLSRVGTAGSFFKNPVISKEAFVRLQNIFPEIPSYPVAEKDDIKIPIAWIIDHVLGMRGYTIGPVGFFEQHALVLVAYDGATAHDIDVFAKDVAQRVHDATNIVIEREVRELK
jgi:UDP-N-acetylmuramate dehydrogenase